MLLQFGLDHADEDGLPIYLESSMDGQRVYPRYGFEVVGEFEMLDGAYIEKVMTRQPKKRN